ncbi:glycoside hydrolase family 2 protein [Periconia macrospinosa]|uniref:Glycoside hydrolase family 2 protein n=1 Tax=Periconia macrospinosa TaxID=97972 RepID=A0A2V1DD80_9PLEO|nr:glycoside hydrolase family 2 protein [Periconia macrospinosa]
MGFNTFSFMLLSLLLSPSVQTMAAAGGRDRSSLNAEWKFSRFESNPDSLSYDGMKAWILPSANDYIDGDGHQRPSGTPPGSDVEYVKPDFSDDSWETIDLPHDWAIKGPFNPPGSTGHMGRLPTNGVGWYRKKVSFTDKDLTKNLYLDVDGAYSYAAVWLNGVLVGGWPYPFNSWRLDLTPYAKSGDNQLAIRLDNALESSRWYPGAGIYRNVWLVKVNPTHIAHSGTYVSTPKVSAESASINVAVLVENSGNSTQEVDVSTQIFVYDANTKKATGDAVASLQQGTISVERGKKQSANASVDLANPQLWGPPPNQKPNQYVAITKLFAKNSTDPIDTYETPFGLRSIIFDATKGVLVNGEALRLQGTCNHHDLGSLGAAFNVRAAERQQQMLQEMGSNALRTSHNPPAPEYLEISDRLGMLVLDEIFDTWNNPKLEQDFHSIFPDWREPDTRNFVRRDRNHPSVIAWSVGNEIPEQGNDQGTETGTALRSFAKAEDPVRPVTLGMNGGGANTGLAAVIDIKGLNYLGEGGGTDNNSAFPSFRDKFPDSFIFTTESASTVSTRGTFLFPVADGDVTVIPNEYNEPRPGTDDEHRWVSSYDLYVPQHGATPDKVFRQQTKYNYVGGEFVWTGFDYLGEPWPYDSSRSSYFGIIDLAGFKKSRFYLYQAHWRPEFPMAHILPHWTWPTDRVNQTTPIHVYTSGDEAEVFINGESQGRKKKGKEEWRLRWDNVTYRPGNVSVVAYKEGAEWARDEVRTVGTATKLNVMADRTAIKGDGLDLSFVSVFVTDDESGVDPVAVNEITFEVEGPGEIVSTDNGDPTDLTEFPSLKRKAFMGRALAIVRAKKGEAGSVRVKATAEGLAQGTAEIQVVLVPNIGSAFARESLRDPRVLVGNTPNSQTNAPLDSKASLSNALVDFLLDLELLGGSGSEHADVDLGVGDVNAERGGFLESLLEVGLAGSRTRCGGARFLCEMSLVTDTVDAEAVGLDEADDAGGTIGFGVVEIDVVVVIWRVSD